LFTCSQHENGWSKEFSWHADSHGKDLLLNRSKLLGLAFGLVGMLALALPGLASATISGAGSTLVAPLMTNWIAGFESGGGTSVKYSAVGSGEGIKAISNGTVDFGASDAPMTAEQEAGCNDCVTIPWALSATGVGFNLPGVSKRHRPRRNLLGQDQALERSQDRRAEPEGEAARHLDHAGLPQRRLG
jgi:ABC-type phosphate transport system substrate-binding protein